MIITEEVDVKIGLETHVQLDTETKLFCGCPNTDAEQSNTNVCEICLGHPGSRPRLNREVLEQSSKAALSLNCDINDRIFFSRKTYFYPDMSKNYQITQYEIPVGEDGSIEIKLEDDKKNIGIKRIHIEEDPAKTTHVGGSISDSKYTKIDYNRAGTPLIEIVTKPDFNSPEGARAYLKQLEKIMEYLGLYSSDSDFTIKSDANISINGGEKVEVKNITGTSEVETALNYEISRQKQRAKRNKEVKQQTRSYNSNKSATEKLREKETEEDYGYIFDPDLTRQELDKEFINEIRADIPELPKEKLERFQQEYGLEYKLAESLIKEKKLASDFEKLVNNHETELVASWMTGELLKTLNYNDISYKESDVRTEWLEYLFELLEEDKISDRNAEKVLRQLVEDPRDPENIVEENDLLKAEDGQIDEIIEKVLDNNEEAVEDYREGDNEAINFLVGQVMQESGGKADPKQSREKIKEKIG